jgi:hypothetical protein
MAWERFGRVYMPDGSKSWGRSHAALPVPVEIETDIFRVFFSTRDAGNRSHVGWIDVDLSSAPRIMRESPEPVLGPGEDGAFDDDGVSIGSMASADDGVRLYYMGWNLGVRAAWRNAIGFAHARSPLGPFQRYSPGPILDRSPEDPYTLTYPCVLRGATGDWWMWYGSNLTPNKTNIRHVIKSAHSRDGIHWQREQEIAIDLVMPGEHVIVRPTVVNIGDLFLMCFCTRGTEYRIGAARSSDGRQWKRIDSQIGLSPSPQGWDSEMTCYPALFFNRGRLWLAYNGDGYGRSGLGFAVWDGDIPILD